MKPGDIVTVKCGGPKMVIALIEEKFIWCVWHNPRTHEILDHRFYADALKHWIQEPLQ